MSIAATLPEHTARPRPAHYGCKEHANRAPTLHERPRFLVTIAPSPKAKPLTDAGPIACQSTVGFPELLKQLGASVLVTTYQANKLFIAREFQGQLNTHFRDFRAPMGLALSKESGFLAVGAHQQILEFQNQPAVSTRLDPPGRHDACFMPRAMHQTGEISVHDLAWAGPELWIVNTCFSCLCTLDREHSFVPRWRPPFISALAPEEAPYCSLYPPVSLSLPSGRLVNYEALSMHSEIGLPHEW